MNTYDASSRGFRESPTAGLFRTLFDTPFARRGRALRMRIDALRALSNTELREIGIDRADIVSAVLRGRHFD